MFLLKQGFVVSGFPYWLFGVSCYWFSLVDVSDREIRHHNDTITNNDNARNGSYFRRLATSNEEDVYRL